MAIILNFIKKIIGRIEIPKSGAVTYRDIKTNMPVRRFKKLVGNSWRMDETYIKVNGARVYLYGVVARFTYKTLTC